MFLLINGDIVRRYFTNNIHEYKQVICNKNIKDYEIELLRKMHQLRYKTFFQKLHWSKGLDIIDEMEFDNFDNPDAKFLIHINSKNIVDACTRLLPTNKPYLLGNCYSDFITKEPIPSHPDIYETTRFVVDNEQSDVSQLLPKTIAAMLCWGIQNNVKNFVSLTTAGTFVKALRRLGWDPQELGPEMKTPDDTAVALKYSAGLQSLLSVCNRSNIQRPQVFTAYSSDELPLAA